MSSLVSIDTLDDIIMMKWFFFFVLFFAHVLLAQTHPYYGQFTLNKLQGMTSNQARRALHKISAGYHIKQYGKPDIIYGFKPPKGKNKRKLAYKHKQFSYRKARHILYTKIAPENINGKSYIAPAYCNSFYQIPSNFPTNPNAIELIESLSINAEHIYPKHRFKIRSTEGKLKFAPDFNYQLADLHNLVPANARHNAIRNNFLFAETTTKLPHKFKRYKNTINRLNKNLLQDQFGIPRNQSLWRYLNDSIEDSVFYEPDDRYKGPFARKILYDLVRYKINTTPISFFYLKKWHIENPPTPLEIEMNNKIFKEQLNRNMFIDMPEIIYLFDNTEFLTSKTQ